jgi:ABC-type phosphate transport system substrate-binding protein
LEGCFTESAAFWGAVSGLAYFAIVYENMVRERNSSGTEECCAQNIMLVCTCRSIYPLGYMMGTTGWYNGIIPAGNIDVVYNIADAINKIGFGLVIYTLAVKSQTN